MQSRATRHTLSLLANVIGSDHSAGKRFGDGRSRLYSRRDFAQFICETQQMYLVQCATSVLVAVLDESSGAAQDSGTLMSLSLSKPSHLSWSVLGLFSAGAMSEQDSFAAQSGGCPFRNSVLLPYSFVVAMSAF